MKIEKIKQEIKYKNEKCRYNLVEHTGIEPVFQA